MRRALLTRQGWIITQVILRHRIVVTRVCFLKTASRARNKIPLLGIGCCHKNQGTLSKTRLLPRQQVTKTIRESFCRMARRQVRVGRKLLLSIRYRRNWLPRLSRTTFCPCSKATIRNSSSRSITKCKEQVQQLGGNSNRLSLDKYLRVSHPTQFTVNLNCLRNWPTSLKQFENTYKASTKNQKKRSTTRRTSRAIWSSSIRSICSN